MTSKILLVVAALLLPSLAWESLPQIPTGKRAQFLVLHENGGYKYGYDTGAGGSAAKQSADASNQVTGHYFYKNSLGQDVDVKYTAGVQGFVPEGLEKLQAGSLNAHSAGNVPINRYSVVENEVGAEEGNSGDASYKFQIDTDSYKRHEVADANGNVQGSYSYSNADGTHNIQYVAGENTGFVATSGSLAKANGLNHVQSGMYNANNHQVKSYANSAYGDNAENAGNADGSYAYSYSTGESAHQAASDANNNVQGRFSYQDQAGHHDLSYVAGAKTGFQVTGGSLAQPNGLAGQEQGVSAYSANTHQQNYGQNHQTSQYVAQTRSSLPSQDGSYSFSYNAGDHARQEHADAAGNVQGAYSYQSGAGAHDLKYVAGAATGFLPVGGNLASVGQIPHAGAVQSKSLTHNTDDEANSGDTSYSFTVDTDEYTRHEASDANGNVQGQFSYKNAAGNHDLSYVAGSGTGFLATGGSLSSAPGLSKSQLESAAQSKWNSGHSGAFAAASRSAMAYGSAYPVAKSSSYMHYGGGNAIARSGGYKSENAVVHTYLPPSNDKMKFGYIYKESA